MCSALITVNSWMFGKVQKHVTGNLLDVSEYASLEGLQYNYKHQPLSSLLLPSKDLIY